MIELTRMQLTNFAAHYVGNKGLGEAILKTDKEFEFKDDFTKNTMVQYLTNGFKNDIYYQFKPSEVNIYGVKNYIESIFKYKTTFLESSQKIAELLYNQTLHPKIKGGELYFAYLKEVMVDGVICDAVGIFKSETVDTFIKLDIVPSQNSSNENESRIITDSGCGLDKLDRGVLIFNTDSENGYKISIIDKSAKIAEASFYWTEDFLGVKLKHNAYYHTSHALNQCVSFCEEVLTNENNVDKKDQLSVLNKSVNYFKDNDVFDENDFNNHVLQGQDDVIEAFKSHKEKYNQIHDIKSEDTFDISKTAVKEKNKYAKSVIKLDKNFHLYIHGRHDLVEKGYDDDKAMGFYKVYFIHDEM
jgi:hypothetical protein